MAFFGEYSWVGGAPRGHGEREDCRGGESRDRDSRKRISINWRRESTMTLLLSLVIIGKLARKKKTHFLPQ